MTVTRLTQAGALQPGSEVWALPLHRDSDWLPLIDWHLNFLIARSTLHQPKTLDPEITLLSQDWSFEVPQFQFTELDHLLIPVAKRLPTDFVMVHGVEGSWKKWIEQIISKTKLLNKQSLRIFLPRQTDVLQVEEFLNTYPYACTLVPHPDVLS